MDDEAHTVSSRSNNTPTALPPPSALSNLEQQAKQLSLLSPSAQTSAGQENSQQGTGGKEGTGKGKKKKVSGSERRRRQKERAEAAAEPRLPPELIYRIMEFGADLKPGLRFYGNSRTEGHAFLCAASLVHSSWRAEAQKLLCRDVLVLTDKAARSVLSSTVERKTTTFATFILNEEGPGLNGQLVQEGLQRLQGVEIMELDGVEGFSLSFLSAPGLSNLKKLMLSPTLRYPSKVYLPKTRLSFPFELDSLFLTFCWSGSTNYLKTFGPLMETTVGKVSLMFNDSTSQMNHSPAVRRSDPLPRSSRPIRLTELDYAGPNGVTDQLLPLFARCIALKKLKLLTLPYPPHFNAMPSTLDQLTIRPPRHGFGPGPVMGPLWPYEAELQCLRANYPCMSELKVLAVLEGGSAAGLKVLKKECESRGIVMDVQSTYQMDRRLS